VRALDARSRAARWSPHARSRGRYSPPGCPSSQAQTAIPRT
jgi:hypothetical protein